jgi:hypothetical protein
MMIYFIQRGSRGERAGYVQCDTPETADLFLARMPQFDWIKWEVIQRLPKGLELKTITSDLLNSFIEEFEVNDKRKNINGVEHEAMRVACCVSVELLKKGYVGDR